MTGPPEVAVRSQIVPLVLSFVPPDVAAALIETWKLDPGRLADRPLEVPLSVEQGLPDDAARLLGDPFLGVHLAEALPRGAMGLPEFVARAAGDLRGMIELLLRYLPLMDDAAEFELLDREGLAWLTHRFAASRLACGRQGNELMVCAFARLVSDALGRPWVPARALFAHPRPGHGVSPLEASLPGARLEFGLGYNAVAFSPADLSSPLQSSDGALFSVLAQLAEEKLAAAPRRASWLTRARVRLVAQLASGPRLETLGRALRMSPRTLQRKLEAEHLTFGALLEDVRREQASMLLADRTLKLDHISTQLGYSDASAFSRAFTRWHGLSPARYRDRLLATR